jgi:hypothetical protein
MSWALPVASWWMAIRPGTPPPRWYSARTVWPGPFGRDHEHVNIGARLDQVVVHVEAVAEHDVLASTQVRLDLVGVKHSLLFVRHEDHEHVCPLGGFCRGDDFKAFGLCLLAAGGPFLKGDLDLLHTAVAHVQHVSVALAAIADNGHFLALDKGEICVLLVINFHGLPFGSVGGCSG